MNKTTILAAALLGLPLIAPSAQAQTQSSANHGSVISTVPTTTHSPRASKPGDTGLADGQGMSAIDADLAERVRRAVVADRNLSTYAAKINIVSNDLTVRLSGVVQNEGERAQIGSKAAAIAGQQHVVNDLKAMPATAGGTTLRDLLQQASVPRTSVTAAN